jgi:ribonuclease HII
MKNYPDFSIENQYKNFLIAAIDEVGRGPLCGPVVAACAILNQDDYPKKINDSKKLSKKERLNIFEELKKKSKFGIGIVSERKIDEINILEATKLAMFLAYQDLCNKYRILPQIILVDGNFSPFIKQDEIVEILPIIKGDQKSISIAAASIIAKETRDKIMLDLHQKFPHYGFDRNAGYGTKFHIEQIHKFGICEFHRKSFEPIKSWLK